MKQFYKKFPIVMLTLIVGLLATSTAFGTANIVIQNNDPAGSGFNDPTPVTPIGGNGGTTLGQQRLNAFQFAASIWGATITSGPTITIRASWANLDGCTANAGPLGQAGATATVRNFPNAPFPDTLYSVALANALSNTDLNGSSAEISAQFNSNLGNAGCLVGVHWYYGLDNNDPNAANGIDLVTVLIHEFGHGLGFQTFTRTDTGVQPNGFPSIFDRFLRDDSTGKTWQQMTNSERVASAINTNNLVWNGPQVVSDAATVLAPGSPRLRVNSPPEIAGSYEVGTADFGPAVTSTGVTAGVVQAFDADDPTSGATSTNACSALTNGAQVSGKIALIDRGGCNFTVKVKNAQNAGAVAVIIVNNASGIIGMTGSDSTITIPTLSITSVDGTSIKARLTAGVNATLLFDSFARSGADTAGRPRMYAPNPWEQGSSVSHWDISAFPNQLMEPNINLDLTHSVTPPQDLTFSLLRDIGWCSGCAQPPPPPPTPSPTVPVNNDFANAQILSGCAGSVNGSNELASKETGEPNNPDSPSSMRSVWYQWQAPSTGNVTITTAGSTFDTVLAVYVGNSLTSLGTAIAHNDDTQTGTTSSVTFPATAGTVYRITVNGYDNDSDGGDTGNIVLNWSGCTFQSTTLTSSQVEIKTWTVGGRTFAYVKLLFPNGGYRVANFGQPVKSGSDFSADATIEQQTGTSVQAVTTTATIYDLGPVAEGNYTFTFKNSGSVVKSQAFTVSSATPPPNPIDDARTFVQQQYLDFLNRQADTAGENFWTGNITLCSDPTKRPAGQTEAQCTLRQRETTSGAFFQSPEFQYTGYFVYRMYQGALGRQPKLSEFTPDALTVGNGIVVNGALSGATINQNKTDFAAQFVNCTDATKSRCAEFKAIYDGLNNQQYVDRLFQTTGVNASASDRAALVNELNANLITGRASVLQKVVDGVTVLGEGNQQFNTSYGQAFYNAESNRAFVLLEYFGYMKRDPDDAGYAFWLGKLNQFNGNFVNAEMVLAFISSPEYRARFGQP